MVSFARARTRSWISRLWPVKVKPIKNDTVVVLSNCKEVLEKQQEQNKCFLEASKNGGIWFS